LPNRAPRTAGKPAAAPGANNLVAAKYLTIANPPDPPLGFMRLFDGHFASRVTLLMNSSSRRRYSWVNQLLWSAPGIVTNAFGSLADRKSFSPEANGIV
jgi:hypothetical protein